MKWADFFVTFNLLTITAAVVSGYLMGRFVIRDTVVGVLSRFLENGRIDAIAELVPLLLVLIGIPIVVTFYTSQILTDILSQSANVIERAAGRGVTNLIFVVFLAIGTARDNAIARKSRH